MFSSLLDFIPHHSSCQKKQTQRQQKINDLPQVYHEPLTSHDKVILEQPIAALIEAVQTTPAFLDVPGDMKTTQFRQAHPGLDPIEPLDILHAYGKKALQAHKETNCLTEIMISEAERWSRYCNRQGPLAGVPVSLKDTVGVGGWDSCIGYSAWVGKPAAKDSALVRLLRDAGAVPFVKTNVPTTLLSFESSSDVFGATKNPHKSTHSPGGSTGGEAALLAFGGSRVGIGTDVAGSVRVPAHYSGIYSVRCSVGRFPKFGSGTSMPGQEGVPAVYSPMARTLGDLETFWKAIVSMKPWEYDHSCLDMPWKKVDLSGRKLKWGVMWDDGVVSPSPACERALRIVVDLLRRHDHQVIDIHPPSPFEGLSIASQLLLADGGLTACGPIRFTESNDPGMVQAMRAFSLPRFSKRIWAWYHRTIRHDETYATLIEGWNRKSMPEYLKLVAKREAYRARWYEFMKEEELDFILCVPNPLPAQRHGQIKDGWKSCNYTFLFNLLDYTAGVLPITHVDATQDRFPSPSGNNIAATTTAPPPPPATHRILGSHKPRNAIEASQQKAYDAADMHGLPVGVQVVGRRLEEENVMEAMKIIYELLNSDKKAYQMIPV